MFDETTTKSSSASWLLLALLRFGQALVAVTVMVFTFPVAGDLLTGVLSPVYLFERTVRAFLYPTALMGIAVLLSTALLQGARQGSPSRRRWAWAIPVGWLPLMLLPPNTLLPPTFAVSLALSFIAMVALLVFSWVTFATPGLVNRLAGGLLTVTAVGSIALLTYTTVTAVEVMKVPHLSRTVTTVGRTVEALGVWRHAEQVIVTPGGVPADVRPGCSRTAVYRSSVDMRRSVDQIIAASGIAADRWEYRTAPDGMRGVSILMNDIAVILVQGRTSVGVTVIDTRAGLDTTLFGVRVGN